jgi:hypothetical protein
MSRPLFLFHCDLNWQCLVERFTLIMTAFVSFWTFISFTMDAPPIPRHGAPSAPGESVRVDVFPFRTRCAKLCLLYHPDRRTVSGQSAGLHLEILGHVDRSPRCCCKYIRRFFTLPEYRGTERTLFRLSVVLDHRCLDRDTCAKYAIQCDERLGSCDQDLGERRRLLVVRKGSTREWKKTLQRSAFAVSDNHAHLFFIQPYVRQMSQKAHNPAPSAESFKQSYAWCPVKDAVRGAQLRRWEQEQGRFVPLYERSGLQEI